MTKHINVTLIFYLTRPNLDNWKYKINQGDIIHITFREESNAKYALIPNSKNPYNFEIKKLTPYF